MSMTDLALIGPEPDYWRDVARGPVLSHLHKYATEGHDKRIAIEKALHGFLLGDHRDELSARLRAIYPNSADRFNATGQTVEGRHGAPIGHRQFELVRMYSDRLAVVFHEMPELYLADRLGNRLPDSDPQAQQWARDLEQLGLHTVLQTAERWTWAMRQPFVAPMWLRGQLRWHVYAPHQVRIEPDPLMPSELDAAPHVTVVVPQGQNELTDYKPELYVTWQRVEDGGRVRWYMWVHDEGGGLKQNTVFADNVNRYGTHPLAVWRIEQPADGEFWLPGNDAWYQQQLSADVKLSDLDHHLSLQVHSQPFVRGAGDLKGKIPTGPDMVFHTDDRETEFSFVTPDPNLAALIDSFNFSLRTAAVAEGLQPDTWEPNSSTRNLAAKKLEREALMHRRRRVIPWFIAALQKTFEKHKAVANLGRNRVKYTDDVRLGVELVPLPEINDRAQDTQATQIELESGLVSVVDVIRQRHGLTRAEAIRHLERVRAENERYAVVATTQMTEGTQGPPDSNAA